MCDTGCKSHLHVFRCVLHGLSPSEGDSAEHRLPESNPDVLFARVTVVCTVLKVKLCRVFFRYIQKHPEIQKSCVLGHYVAVIHVATVFNLLCS